MDAIDGVAPPGFEKVVRKMKKGGDVSNPWALAWWMHNKDYRPSRRDEDEDAAGYSPELQAMAQATPPEICLAAARGEAWAHIILLARNRIPFVMETPR